MILANPMVVILISNSLKKFFITTDAYIIKTVPISETLTQHNTLTWYFLWLTHSHNIKIAVILLLHMLWFSSVCVEEKKIQLEALIEKLAFQKLNILFQV